MNALFQECLLNVSPETKRQFELSDFIAERLDSYLKENQMSQSDLAKMVGKSKSEISRWMTGRHNFTFETVARIETAIGRRLLDIAH